MSRGRRLIYWRDRGGVKRAYADLRAHGGRREPLVARGEKLATADPVVAEALLGDRLKQLEAERRGRNVLGLAYSATLETFAAEHLEAKAKAGKTTDRWLESSERFLARAVTFFGSTRELMAIDVAAIEAFVEHLRTLPGVEAERDALERQARGEEPRRRRRRLTMSGGTIRHHLNCLSNLYRRAQARQVVVPGYNPVAALLEKPTARHAEAKWLEVHDAALLLEAARTYTPQRSDLAMPFARELLATFLLTGGRRSEVVCLEADDVSFDRQTVTFRPNVWRDRAGLRQGMKTDTSWRAVPLWPQLAEILRPYILPPDRTPRTGLLFPSYRTGEASILTDCRKLLDAIATRAGWRAGEITTKMFRHTYTAARLQTLDQGAPVSEFTVARELGHGGEAMVRRVYGHLGQVRHRADAVEYRVEQHVAQLGDRLAALLAPPVAPRDRPAASAR